MHIDSGRELKDMSSGTRKGFKYKTKGSKASRSRVEVEDIDFDEIEKETTSSPQKRTSTRGGKRVASSSSDSSPVKRGRRAAMDTDREVDLSPSPKKVKIGEKTSAATKTSVDKSPVESGKPKAHYPRNSSLDVSRIVQKIKRGKDKDSSHKVKLGLLLREICNSELDR